jgi:hypothetical protein
LSSSKSIDREAPVQGAVVIHPDREGRGLSRSAAVRLEEAVGLALALDLEVRETLVANLRQLTPATLFGKGKVEEIGHTIELAEADVAIVDDALTPVQQRNLEKAWQVKVIDRTGLILEIFARRAGAPGGSRCGPGGISRTRAGQAPPATGSRTRNPAWSAPGPTWSASAAALASWVAPAKPRSRPTGG